MYAHQPPCKLHLLTAQLDDNTVNITSPSLRSALALTVADRRWIDSLHQTIVQTWDPADPARPRHHGYLGSEDFLRLQFEEYLLALLAAAKYHDYLYATPHDRRDLAAFAGIEGDPAADWGEAWLAAWQEGARNHALWQRATDPHLFDLVEPRHPSAGAFSIDDLTRRFQHQVVDLRLDERWTGGRKELGKHWAHGRERVSSAIAALAAEVEARRAAHAQRASAGGRASDDDDGARSPSSPGPHALPSPSTFALPATPTSPASTQGERPRLDASGGSARTPTRSASQLLEHAATLRSRAPDLSGAGAAVGAAGQRAGAYLSSWGAWASERRKGWGGNGSSGGASPREAGASPVGAGGTTGAAAVTGRGNLSRPCVDGWGLGAGRENGLAEKEALGSSGAAREPKSPTSPPRTSPRKGSSRKIREEVGSDGIGRLDA